MKQQNKMAHGRFMSFINAIKNITDNYPDASPEHIYTQLAQWYPQIKNQERCPNCDGSMKTYVFQFDVLDAILLIFMQREVAKNKRQGMTFTEANKVHIQTIDGISYAAKSRTSKCRQLGLIAKFLKPDGRQKLGTWCITKRGWKALKNEPIPAEVRSFRNKIIERSEETTTIKDALHTYKTLRKKKHADYSLELNEIEKFDWVKYGSLADGEIF